MQNKSEPNLQNENSCTIPLLQIKIKKIYLESLNQRSRLEPSKYVPNSDMALPVGDKDQDSFVVIL